ncbi:hypothetical protein V496_08367 [Pseudogymnoascus sp. VKM F-4515 (FW-2607)]|nr:hypothetical protein V496_08367 [Pseudogymnoascus sp. VKM F-4515 (FW-2607)]
MNSSGLQTLGERRIADDKAISQETHYAHVYESTQCSRAKAGEDGLAEQISDTSQAQDILKGSTPEILSLPQHLRKMKALSSNFFQNHPKKVKRNATTSQACVDETIPTQPATMFAIKFESPWVEYEYIRQSEQVTVVRQRSSYFRLANMQEFPATNTIQQSQVLARVSHPNIASIYGVYSYIDKLLVVTEHLDISLAQLDFQSYQIEEWEIATIVAEVLKGLTYVYSMNISCQDLTIASIRLSVRGEVKLLLSMENVRYHQVENPRFAPALLEMPVLEEMIEAMTLPRYHHTSDDQRWSNETLSFLSCSILGSLQNLNDHRFVMKAVSPRKLIPRIRFTLEMESSTSNANNVTCLLPKNGSYPPSGTRSSKKKKASSPQRHGAAKLLKSAPAAGSNEIVTKPGL